MNISYKLEEIQIKLNALIREIEHEEKVLKLEQKDRKEKDLKGEKALEHWNKWMYNYGLTHLIID